MLDLDMSKIYHMHVYPIKEILKALSDYNVKIICFGSSVKGTATWRSDIDIAFAAKDPEEDSLLANILANIEFDEDYPNFDMDIVPIRLIKRGPLLNSLEDGMLLKDWR